MGAAPWRSGCAVSTPLMPRPQLPGVTVGPCFVVSVSDSGHGMDDATRARIFEPFFSTKPAGEGAGLGLSTAYAVLRDWKGAITVASEVGRGTTFTLYIPITETR